jgi:hypothetical protein
MNSQIAAGPLRRNFYAERQFTGEELLFTGEILLLAEFAMTFSRFAV